VEDDGLSCQETSLKLRTVPNQLLQRRRIKQQDGQKLGTHAGCLDTWGKVKSREENRDQNHLISRTDGTIRGKPKKEREDRLPLAVGHNNS
jgi:hypothetical protein